VWSQEVALHGWIITHEIKYLGTKRCFALSASRWIHKKQIAVHPEEPVIVLATAAILVLQAQNCFRNHARICRQFTFCTISSSYCFRSSINLQ
jgi:hypothetical protein